MFSFLESYYELTGSDDIGGLLGSMALLENGKPADAAILNDWEESLKKARKKLVNAEIKIEK